MTSSRDPDLSGPVAATAARAGEHYITLLRGERVQRFASSERATALHVACKPARRAAPA